jgi:hypothetical protein
MHRALDGFTGGRVPTATVRPYTGEYALALGTSCDEQPTDIVERVTGKREMARRMFAVHGGLVRDPDRLTPGVEQDYLFVARFPSHRARQLVRRKLVRGRCAREIDDQSASPLAPHIAGKSQ